MKLGSVAILLAVVGLCVCDVRCSAAPEDGVSRQRRGNQAMPPPALYVLDCRITESPEGVRIEGTETIHVENRTSGRIDRLQVHWPNPGVMHLEVVPGGTPAGVLRSPDGSQPEAPFVLELTDPIEPGREAVVRLSFSMNPLKPARGLPGLYLHWHPKLRWGSEGHDDYRVRLAVPPGYTVGASGPLDEATGCYQAEHVKSFGLFLAPGISVLDADASGVQVRVLCTAAAEECAQLLREVAVDAIEFYRERFGFYPYRSLTIVPGEPDSLGGFPVATAMVAVHAQEKMGEFPGYPWRRIVAHEIGHQYWGEWVLEKDSPGWLWIALGIYADREWSRARGQDMGLYRQYLDRFVSAVRDGADTRLQRAPGESMAGWDNHSTGYCVVSALESVMGEAAFARAYQRCLDEFGGARMGASEFQEVCEQECGRSLEWFFDQWLRSSTYPSYQVSSQTCEREGDRYVSRIRVACSGTMRMPVPVEAVFEDGQRRRAFTERELDVSELRFDSSSPLAAATVDPDGVLPLVVPPPSAEERKLRSRLRDLPWVGVGEEALALWASAQQHGLEDAELVFKLAMLLYDGAYYDEALAGFKRVAATDANPIWAFICEVWQGHVLDLLGRRGDARAHYEAALRLCETQAMPPIRHDQYGIELNREWLRQRLQTPFQRESAPTEAGEEPVAVEENVHLYGSGQGAGLDWRALRDEGNAPILSACLEGAGREDLARLGLPDLPERLERLREGRIIRATEEGYELAFPVVTGEQRADLQALVEDAARQVLPKAEETVEELRSALKGREDMLYHVAWSLVMDSGPAWHTLEQELERNHPGADTAMWDTVWLVYPPHRHLVGTNIDMTPAGNWLYATWSDSTPDCMPTFEVIRRGEAGILDCWRRSSAPGGEQSTAVGGGPAEQAESGDEGSGFADLAGTLALAATLMEHGLADQQGQLRLYVFEADSREGRLHRKLAADFAREVARRFDVQQASQQLGVPPGRAMVIAYHEICWEVLAHLAERGSLEVPAILTEPGVETDQMVRLISLRLGGPAPFE